MTAASGFKPPHSDLQPPGVDVANAVANDRYELVNPPLPRGVYQLIPVICVYCKNSRK